MVKARCGPSTWRTGWARAGSRSKCSPGVRGAHRHAWCHSHVGKDDLGLVCPSQRLAWGRPGHLHAWAWLAAAHTTGQSLTELGERPPSDGRSELGGCWEEESLQEGILRTWPQGPHGDSRCPPTLALGASTCFPRLRYIFSRT